MDLGLRGRKALVTGASKGIGRACAEILAEEGCDVVLVSRTAADLEAVRAKIAGEHNVSVRYYAVEAGDAEAEARNEVDEVRWASLADAAGLLTHRRDRALLRRAARRLG